MQGVADFEEGGVRPVRRTDENSRNAAYELVRAPYLLTGGDAGIGTMIMNRFEILGTH